jgi:hypothetical protein
VHRFALGIRWIAWGVWGWGGGVGWRGGQVECGVWPGKASTAFARYSATCDIGLDWVSYPAEVDHRR